MMVNIGVTARVQEAQKIKVSEGKNAGPLQKKSNSKRSRKPRSGSSKG